MASRPCEAALNEPPSPRAVPQAARGKTATRIGGYTCEFVEKPPEVFQSDCPICLSILRDPHQVTCCGYSFCRTCVDQVRLDSKPCPTCNEEGFTTFANKGLQRSLNQLSVRCTHKDDGCEWTGELGELDKHSNENPGDTSSCLQGCQYANVECFYCTKSFKRSVVKDHLNHCPQRPYSCDYCRDYEGSFDDVVNKHYPVCKCFPLRCPNKCDELQEGFKYMIERQNLVYHLKEECILRLVECDFHYAGCGVKLPRKDMAGHLAGSVVAHMSLLAAHGKKTAADAQKALEERDKEIVQLREDAKRREEEIQETARKQLEERDRQVALMQEDINKLKIENRSLKDRLHSHLHTPPVTFTMTNFEQHKRKKDTWVSPPFYTHPHGYKMCLTVTTKTNSLRDDFGPHFIIVQACLMRGEFDGYLQWPFQSDVYIRILNQLADDNHIAFAATFSRGPVANGEGMRVIADDRQSVGRPLDIPIALRSLLGGQRTQQYLRDDCIRIQVIRVANTVQFTESCLAISATPPVQLVMNDFEQHKRDGDMWRSPSFYSHSQGYKMCINVAANGYSDGVGACLFISIAFLRGEYDSTLKWPFEGTVRIEILNQLRDKEHSTCYIDSIVRERVITGVVSLSWGVNSLPHSELGFDPAKNCQYLKDNCLVFRVSSVKIDS